MKGLQHEAQQHQWRDRPRWSDVFREDAHGSRAVTITLSPAELQSITGYKRPGDQLRELHRQGFYRACRARGGKAHVVLERLHYEAVKSGQGQRAPSVDVSWIQPSTRRGTARPMDWAARTALYRHFDKTGALLYVGIAVDPRKRESAHRSGSEWAPKIHRIELEWFDNRHAARAAERAAIATERPKFNILHQGKP
jgi:predicted GIY-YIG superfamily endonuclease